MDPEPQKVILQDHFPTQNQTINTQFTESDPKKIQEQLQNYSKLKSQQRINIVKNLPIMLQQLGNKGIKIIKSLLDKIIQQRNSITQILLSKIPDLVAYLQKHENFQNQLKTTIIPILIKFINFNQLQIKQNAGRQLSRVTHKLNDNARGDYVLRHVIQMAHDDTNIDNRIVAVQLFSSMSDCFGKQLCQQYISKQILSLGDDPNTKVGQQALSQLPVISKLVSPEFFNNRFLTFFCKKSKSIVMNFRKKCAEIINCIAELATNQQKQGNLSNIMLALLNDKTKQVKIAAHKNLGKFIYLLKGLKINESLIKQFCNMPDKDFNQKNKQYQNQIIYYCAYNFPAVTQVLGPSRWPDLYKAYQKLLKCNSTKIKITLSQGLHQIAKIIGQQHTQKNLFKVIDMFFKQKNDQIKLGFIKHLAQIMQVLSIEKRQSLVGVFQQFQKDQKKWRIRQCICKQLGKLLQIYSTQIIFQYMVPLLLKFCSDTVSIVRQEATIRVADFIIKLSTQQGHQNGLIQSVKAFGTSPKFTQRQSFLMMCSTLITHKQLFKNNFLDILINLKNDRVINVKLVLAQLVKNYFDSHGQLSNQEKFISLYHSLKNSDNQEIKSVFNNS